MQKKNVVTVFTSVLVLLSILCAGPTMPVNASVIHPVLPGESIQEAIDSAQPGDTVFVFNGTYSQQVFVNKSLTLIGQDANTTIIEGVQARKASNVRISGFTIRWSIHGIALNNCSSTTIRHNIVKNNMQYGIFLEDSRNIIVSDNMILSNGDRGVYVRDSSNNTISNNTVSVHSQFGILLYNSHNNVISANTVSSTIDCGIRLDNSRNNTISNNVISKNSRGLNMMISPRNTLRDNNMTDNSSDLSIDGVSLNHFIQDIDSSNTVQGKPVCYWVNQHNKQVPSNAGYVALVNSTNIIVKDLNMVGNDRGVLFFFTTNSTIMNVNASHNHKGIDLIMSGNNNIFANTITSNSYGIYLDFSSGNRVFGNTVKNNNRGIFSLSCNNTIYHNNFISNTKQMEGYLSSNVWHNNYPSGGNYWSNYTGVDLYSGPFQNENGSDGIGDTPYEIDSDNQDNYPIISPIRFFKAYNWDEKTYYVHVTSNSSISDFYFSKDYKVVGFNVSGTDETVGFCRVVIPRQLMWCESLEEWNVTINGGSPTFMKAMEDNDYTYLHFSYNHSIQEAQIKGIHVIPEFPPFLVLQVFMIATLLAIIVRRKKEIRVTL